MRTATVRDFRCHYTSLLSGVGAGAQIIITGRGMPETRLILEKPEEPGKGKSFRSNS